MKKYILLIGILVYAACTEEEPLRDRPYPKVEETTITRTGSIFTFSSEIPFTSVEIVDHGFKWAKYQDPMGGNAEGISLGPTSSPKEFSYTRLRETPLNSIGEYYIVRAYVQSDKYLFYGPPKVFCCP
ncbi:MAG: hypothetical protein ACOYXT_23955 [Bacteroidota bacterium]